MFKWRTLGEIFTNFDSWIMHMDKTTSVSKYFSCFTRGTYYPSSTVFNQSHSIEFPSNETQ